MAATPECISWEMGHFSSITEQKQLSEATHLLQGHFVKYDTSGGGTTCHIHFFGCDKHLLLLLSCDLSSTLQKQRWKCVSAPPSFLLAWKPSESHLSSSTAVTRWHLIPFSLWNVSLMPSYSLIEPSPLVAFLWISTCAYGHYPIPSYK